MDKDFNKLEELKLDCLILLEIIVYFKNIRIECGKVGLRKFYV